MSRRQLMWHKSADEWTYKFGSTQQNNNAKKPDVKQFPENPISPKPKPRKKKPNVKVKLEPISNDCQINFPENPCTKEEITHKRLYDAIFCVESEEDLSGQSNNVDLSL